VLEILDRIEARLAQQERRSYIILVVMILNALAVALLLGHILARSGLSLGD
jgi:hypothetical protein